MCFSSSCNSIPMRIQKQTKQMFIRNRLQCQRRRHLVRDHESVRREIPESWADSHPGLAPTGRQKNSEERRRKRNTEMHQCMYTPCRPFFDELCVPLLSCFVFLLRPAPLPLEQEVSFSPWSPTLLQLYEELWQIDFSPLKKQFSNFRRRANDC